MYSPDDYDFDDPHHQADLDGIIERLLARRRVDRSRLHDPITIMLDRISDPFQRIEKPSKEPIKPLPAELPAASTVEELRAHLGRRKGPRSGRKVKPLSYEPTLDLELIESMFRRGSTLAQIRAHLRVGADRLRLEMITFLPHIAEEAGKRRGRKSPMPIELEKEEVKRLRARGWGWIRIGIELRVCHKRIMRQYGQPSTASTTSTVTPTALK